MQDKDAYYANMMQHTKLTIGRSQYGDGLFVKEQVDAKEELLQEAPAFSYMVPAYHFTLYAQQQDILLICFHCFNKIDPNNVIQCDCAQEKKQNNQISHCKHIFCSEHCKQRNWMQHCMTCIDNNISQFSQIKSFFSDRNTYSDLAVAEFITQSIMKVVMLYYNGVELETAVNKAIEPYLNLYAPTKVQFQKVNISAKIRVFLEFFKASLCRCGFEIDPDLQEFLINNFISQEFLTFVYSLIAFNSVLIDGVGVGIYTIISKINHSCSPNARLNFVDGEAILQVDYALNSMQEIFISYIDDTLPIGERQSMLNESWGFNCQCPRCQAEQ